MPSFPLTAALALTCAFSMAASAQTPDIKGVRLGMSMRKAADSVPNMKCDSAPRSKEQQDIFCGAPVLYGSSEARLMLLGFGSTVGNVIVAGSNSNWSAIRAGLIQKYGNPARIDHATIQTLAGVALSSETLAWEYRNAKIEADERTTSNVMEFAVTMHSKEWDTEHRKRSGLPGSNM